MEEFQAEESSLSNLILPQNASGDGRSLARNKARGSGSRRWNRQMNDLVVPENMLGSDACPEGANVEGFGELNEFRASGVGASNKDGNLESNTRRTPCRSWLQTLFLPHHFVQHTLSRCSTSGIVRLLASWLPHEAHQRGTKPFKKNVLAAPLSQASTIHTCKGFKNPLDFLNCANGTLLPLTLSWCSVTM